VPRKDVRTKWVDPRTPVWQGLVKGKLLTIYDMAAYDESKLLYPDDPNQPVRPVRTDNDKPTFVKKKAQARYDWVVPIGKPLGKVAQEKGRTA
jgi:hypothetical protein